MDFRILSGGAIAAIAGAAMLAASSAPSPAFTLSAPSFQQPAAVADVELAQWHHGWGWHHGWRGGWHNRWGWHGGWHRWGWGPRYGWGWRHRYYGIAPGWRCWWTPWGFRRCGWV